MKKSNVCIVITIIVIVLIIFLSWLYIGLNGLPWKKMQAKSATENYLAKQYPDLKYELVNTGFNAAFGYYFSNIVTKDNVPIKFEVSVRNNGIEDNYYEKKVDTEAKNMIKTLIQDEVPTITNISVLEDAGSRATSDSYQKYKNFAPGDSYPLKIDIKWAGKTMNFDEFLDETLKVRKILNDKNISLCGLDIYDDKNNYYVNLSSEKGGIYNLSKEDIIKNDFAGKLK